MKLNITPWLLACVFALLFHPAAFGQDAGAPWVSLFNGKDLTGWSLKGGQGKAFVQDGEIVCHITANTTQHTFVCTNDQYSDFILEMNVKIDGDFNTGILFRAVDTVPDAPVRLWSYMVKVDPTSRHWTGGIFEDFGAVWQWLSTLQDLPRARDSFKINEWNRFRIEAIGPHIKVWVNDVPTANLVDQRYTRGYIALKIHWTGNFPEREKILAHFKDIRIITDNPQQYARPTDVPLVTTVDEAGIHVPAGFRTLLVTDNAAAVTKQPGDKLQFLAVGPDSNIYASTVKNGIVAIKDTNGDSRADVIEALPSPGGASATIHDGWLYYCTGPQISRIKLTPAKLIPAGQPETIVQGLPTEAGQPRAAFAFDDQNRILVQAGTSASPFRSFDAGKANQAFADGKSDPAPARTTASMAFSKNFYTVGGQGLYPIAEIAGPQRLVSFPAGWSAQQIAFYNSNHFPKKYRNGAFIAFRGDESTPAGCNVCFVPFTESGQPAGGYEVFATGFADIAGKPPTGHTRFDPCGVAVAGDGTLYISDSQAGRVWRIICTNEPK